MFDKLYFEEDYIDIAGFSETIKNCCGFGGRYNFNLKQGCGAKEVANGTEVLLGKACEKPGEYVVWDGVHFTEAANKFIYDNIVSGAYSDPPTPLDMACHRMG